MIERKTRLDGSVAEFACEPLQVDPGRHAILRYVTDREWAIAGTPLRVTPGTVTIGHYWVDRPYNVYHWIAAGRTLAYYCNVATGTVIEPDLVAYTDLAVDVLVMPRGGGATVLDEDELPPDLAPAHRLTIARALEALADPRPLIREIERASAAFRAV